MIHRARLVLHLCVLLAALSSSVAPAAAAPTRSPGLTVGALIASAFLAKSLAADLIEDASGEALEVLEEVHDMLDELIDELSATYENMLDVTFEQFDEFTRTQLERLYTLTQQLQADLQVGVENLNQIILEDLRFISNEARSILAQATDLVAVAVGGALVVIDKAVFNAAFVIAAVLLGLGLVVFVWLLVARQLPPDVLSRRLSLAGMGFYVLVFGGLLLPQGRAYALTWSGYANRVEGLTQPEIFDVRPDDIVLGKTSELVLLGARLAPDGASPGVSLSDEQLPVTAAGDELVTVDLSGLSAAVGSHTLTLRTAEGELATTAVSVRSPLPLPYVQSWTITPIGDLWEPGGHNTRMGLGCRAPRGTATTTGHCEFEEVIEVAPGYELDLDHPALLGQRPNGETFLNPGPADMGFEEQITTFHPRKRDPADPQRQIQYDPDSGTPTGIRVSGSARSDTTLTPGGTQGEFRATYTVFGRRLNTQGRGADWTFDGSCVISGTVSCGTFDVLEDFVDPPTYTVNATLIGAEGNPVSVSGPVRPNDATSWLPAVLTIEDATGQLQSVQVRLTILEEPATVTLDFEIPGPFGGTRQITRSVRRAELRVAGPDFGVTPITLSPLLEGALEELELP